VSEKPKFQWKPDVPGGIRRLLLSWLTAVAIEYFRLPPDLRSLARLDGLAQMSMGRTVVFTACFFVILFCLSCFFSTARAERWGLLAVFTLLAAGTLCASVSGPYLAVCLLIVFALVIFCWFGWQDGGTVTWPRSIWLWVTVGLSALFFLFLSAWTVGRVYSFSSPTFDFGIFSQMFYSMKETGMPMTTLERGGLLSHFDVHVSPIYYLLLPFYWMFPTPATLQVLQALIITSAAIPLWKIGKHHGLSEAQRTLLCAVLLLYPATSGAASHDIHENCFLTPLILWTLYGADKKNPWITAVAALLTLAVKEDAAVYVAVIALWLLLKALLSGWRTGKRDLLTGAVMLSVSVGWFFLVTGYLAKSGDGVMTYRYDNFMYDGASSLVTVIKSVILNPMKAIFECVDPDKLKFIALTLVPLLGLPLITRRYERYVLLIPYILVNLMSDYPYQHDIFYQYTFGPVAFLLYLTAVNAADIRCDRKRLAALCAVAAVSAGYFGAVSVPKGIGYPIQALRYSGYYQNIRDVLDTVPDDASVTSTTFYTVHLSQRDVLYDIGYCSVEQLLDSDYVVLGVDTNSECQKFATDGLDNGYENLVRLLEENGFSVHSAVSRVLVIYQRIPQ